MEGDLGWWPGGSSNNWDLHAVVRFACGAAASHGAQSSPPTNESFPWASPALPTDPAVDDLCLQALLADPKADAPQPSSPTTQQPTPAADEAPAMPRPSGRGGGGPTRSKRKTKKSQVNKEVTRVPAGSPSADLWAWRKYGQKPIKGSPYPRGYYRCSTDKNCKARKQVERCPADPGTLIITYTGEHSHPVPLHRNSLAGTTRSKPQQQQSSASPPASDSAGLSLSSHADTSKAQGSPSVGVEYEDSKEDDETLSVRLLLEDTEMLTEDDGVLFLMPDEPAPVVDVVPGRAGGCDNDDAMLLPNPEDPAPPIGGNGAGTCDDVTLFPNKPEEPPGPVPVSNGGADDVMLFPIPGDSHAQPMTVSASMTNGGAGTASVINFSDEKFSVSGFLAWEAAAAAAESGWGL